MKRICVYCGSSDKINSKYLDAAQSMGHAIADREIELVYGGGGTGLMGKVADAVLEKGGRVIGVIPEQFNTPALVHNGLSDLYVVDTMHIRKAMMAEMADAFIALPGGFGTLEELFEILTWAQIGLHEHPVGVLNTDDYYQPLLNFIAQAQAEGFIYNEHQSLLLHDSHPARLIESLMAYHPPIGLERWVDR
jgi:uncharacterized protein (TIGR00730 family)